VILKRRYIPTSQGSGLARNLDFPGGYGPQTGNDLVDPEMISDGCADANGKVLVKGVGQKLLLTAQPW
jgi:hypothetical protein